MSLTLAVEVSSLPTLTFSSLDTVLAAWARRTGGEPVEGAEAVDMASSLLVSTEVIPKDVVNCLGRFQLNI